MHSTAAGRKLGFQIHAFVFVVTMPILAVVNYLTGPPWWVLWVVLGWGGGLLAHGIFGVKPLSGGPGDA